MAGLTHHGAAGQKSKCTVRSTNMHVSHVISNQLVHSEPGVFGPLFAPLCNPALCITVAVSLRNPRMKDEGQFKNLTSYNALLAFVFRKVIC